MSLLAILVGYDGTAGPKDKFSAIRPFALIVFILEIVS
jgi:hypothetical protein